MDFDWGICGTLQTMNPLITIAAWFSSTGERNKHLTAFRMWHSQQFYSRSTGPSRMFAAIIPFLLLGNVECDVSSFQLVSLFANDLSSVELLISIWRPASFDSFDTNMLRLCCTSSNSHIYKDICLFVSNKTPPFVFLFYEFRHRSQINKRLSVECVVHGQNIFSSCFSSFIFRITRTLQITHSFSGDIGIYAKVQVQVIVCIVQTGRKSQTKGSNWKTKTQPWMNQHRNIRHRPHSANENV